MSSLLCNRYRNRVSGLVGKVSRSNWLLFSRRFAYKAEASVYIFRKYLSKEREVAFNSTYSVQCLLGFLYSLLREWILPFLLSIGG